MIHVHLRGRFERQFEDEIADWVRKRGAMGPFYRVRLNELPPPMPPMPPLPDLRVTLGVTIRFVTLHVEERGNGDLSVSPASAADAALIDQWCREQEALVE